MKFTNEELERQRMANEMHDLQRERDEMEKLLADAERRLGFLKRMFDQELKCVFGDQELDEAIDYACTVE